VYGTNRCALQTLLKLHKTKAVPALLYGCENWTGRRGRKVSTESAEMEVLRSVAEYALHDRTTSEAVRDELNVHDLLWTVQLDTAYIESARDGQPQVNVWIHRNRKEKRRSTKNKRDRLKNYEDGKPWNDLCCVAAVDVREHMTLLRRYRIEVRIDCVKYWNFMVTPRF